MELVDSLIDGFIHSFSKELSIHHPFCTRRHTKCWEPNRSHTRSLILDTSSLMWVGDPVGHRPPPTAWRAREQARAGILEAEVRIGLEPAARSALWGSR